MNNKYAIYKSFARVQRLKTLAKLFVIEILYSREKYINQDKVETIRNEDKSVLGVGFIIK